MELQMYVDDIQRQLAVAAAAGGDAAQALAERIASPLDAAIRLALQDALAAATEEITRELAPGSVELRIKGRDLEFVVTAAPTTSEDDQSFDGGQWNTSAAVADASEDAIARINLRVAEPLKGRIEDAANREGLSVNSWLVRAATAAVARGESPRGREYSTPRGGQRYTGWAR